MSPFVAALIGTPTDFAEPSIQSQEAEAQFEARLLNYEKADARHQMASGARMLAYMENDRRFDMLFAVEVAQFEAVRRAAEHLIYAPLPTTDRATVTRAVHWKRKVLARFSLSRKDMSDWREVVAEDEARIPSRKPRQRKPA